MVRYTPQGNIELMPEKEVLDFKLTPRPEQVGDERPSAVGGSQASYRMMRRFCLIARINKDGIFGNDRRSKSSRPARQHYRLGDRPRFARALVEPVEPGVGVRLCEARNFDLRVATWALDYGRLANLEALAVIHVIHIRGSLCRDITPVC